MTARGEGGSGTVLVAAAAALAATLLVGALTLCSAVLASHRARAAADLAALAGAGTLQLGRPAGRACRAAAVLAERNEGRLRACHPRGDGSLRVTVAVRASVPGLGAAVARARAGPRGLSPGR
ncbi:MAG TPA: Rv3654c family TadE-like protein [Segeticoccus sp.]|nr:Rv3654c family TadE-like protein [Segeticoccus sp.]